MPIRQVFLAIESIYHIVNRGNAAVPIFRDKCDYRRFVQTFLYYQNNNPGLRFSFFTRLGNKDREKILQDLKIKKDLLVEIIGYCLMPNHFHFLVRQLKKDGIANFVKLTTDSYSRYFNIRHKRRGSLFEGRFKAVRIETDEQLLHVSRYIHLNPFSSYVVKDINNLLEYPFSSLPEYLDEAKEKICEKDIILGQFPNIAKYQKFLIDQADYQRSLDEIRHQLLENVS